MLSARELCRELELHFAYEVVRQRGSHIRLRTLEKGEHSITIPNHDPVRAGTLRGIVKDVAEHFGITPQEVIARMVGRG